VSKAQFHNPQNQISGHDRYHQSFTYDGLNRLKTADYGDGADGISDLFDVTGLDYDRAGNIETLQRNDDTGSLIDDLTYSYSGVSNRLQSLTDAVTSTTPSWDAEDASFGYDGNGNLTSQTGKLTDIAYDHRNLPVHFTMASGTELIADYNADGQRILKETSSGAWSFYVKDGPQTLAVIDQNGFSHFNLVGNSTFGRYTDTGARRYYISDHLGSTRAVVDNNGNVLETFDYYPFGLLMPKRNTAGANTLEKFTGKERDTEGNLNLDYFGARYYDPAIGKFLAIDPLVEVYPGWTPYHYVLNNPISNIDPTGKYVVKGTSVTRVGRNTARVFNLASFSLVGGIAAVANRSFTINDPSFQNSILDYFTIGFGAGLRAAGRGLTALRGVSHTDIRAAQFAMTDIPSTFLSGAEALANSFGDAFVGDRETFTNIVIDETIFEAAAGLRSPSGGLLGELTAGGTEFNLLESSISEIERRGVEGGAEGFLRDTFGMLENMARSFVEKTRGFDIRNERHQRRLLRHLQRQVRAFNHVIQGDEDENNR